VRALLIQRYEKIWGWVEGCMRSAAELERPLDPRIAEIGLRTCKDEAALYRLSRVLPVLEEEEDPAILGVDRQALVALKLSELEAKYQAAEASAKAHANGSKRDSVSNSSKSLDQEQAA